MAIWIIFGVVLASLAAIGLITLKRSECERHEGAGRSSLTVAFVWLVYVAYTAGVALMAWWDLGSLPIAQAIAWSVGGALLAAGVALCAWGMATMRSFDRISGATNDRLLTAGAYRYSRNPQNAGWAIALFGIAVIGGSLLALLMAGVFCAVFVWYTKREERFLIEVFGETYADYCRTTGRFFGRKRGAGRGGSRAEATKRSGLASSS